MDRAACGMPMWQVSMLQTLWQTAASFHAPDGVGTGSGASHGSLQGKKEEEEVDMVCIIVHVATPCARRDRGPDVQHHSGESTNSGTECNKSVLKGSVKCG